MAFHGQVETRSYEDIIEMEYPLKCADRIKHPRMTLEDRAKIFAPFAALKGYDEAIAEKQRLAAERNSRVIQEVQALNVKAPVSE